MFETMTRDEAHAMARRLGDRLTNSLIEAMETENMANVYMVFVNFGTAFLSGVEDSLRSEAAQQAVEGDFQA